LAILRAGDRGGGRTDVCRSIKQLRLREGRASDEEVAAAALQFVRKVSGFREPSRANREAFEAAVAEISEASRRLLDGLNSRQEAQARTSR
jgi:hypothetical protein